MESFIESKQIRCQVRNLIDYQDLGLFKDEMKGANYNVFSLNFQVHVIS